MREQNQNGLTKRMVTAALSMLAVVTAAALVIYSCTKPRNTAAGVTGQTENAPRLKTAGAQPLPQGKARYSVVLGRMDSTPWVRLGNWTFNASNGTVAATFWSWAYDDKHNVQVLFTHTCTIDGVTRQLTENYTPYGWQEPGGLSANWGGNYTYNTTTGRLHIDWTSGNGAGESEDWDVSLPDAALARVKFVAGSSTYNVTHGRGYGSNAPWPNNTGNDHPTAFKTIDELPTNLTVTSTTGRRVLVAKDKTTGAYTYGPNPTGSSWQGAAWGGSSGMGTPSFPVPKNCKQYWDQNATCNANSCAPDQRPGVTGIIYHWSSKNINRQMAWVNFCACLAHTTDPNHINRPLFPAYDGNMHPQAQFQILDDNSVMRGVIGIETQNPPSTGPQNSGYPGFQMQLQDFTTLAGS